MRWSQGGQTMPEYLVVSIALMGAFFWGINADCPGYDNCLAKLKTVMHNKYEGYSNSISAVHQYGDLEGEGFESNWDENPGDGDDDGDDGGSGSGDGGELPSPSMSRTNNLVSPDGSITYGTLSNATEIVDGDGNIIGSYDPAAGTVTLDDGRTGNAVVSSVVTDEEGNPAPLQALVDCAEPSKVYGFAYRSGVTGEYHDSVKLERMEVPVGLCPADTEAVVNTDGDPMTGAIVHGYYYASTMTPNVRDAPMTPSGEVIWFDITVPDEDIYENSSPGIGEQLRDCAVMATGWDADEDREPLDIYLNSSPSPRVGSRHPAAAGVCAGVAEVTD